MPRTAKPALLLLAVALFSPGQSAADAGAHAAALGRASVGAHAAALGPAPSRERLSIVIPLTADDRGLRSFALAVSTPDSPLYGRFSSVSELARRFGATPAVATKVVRYLRSVGAAEVSLSPTGMYVQATMTVGLAERTFGTQLAQMRASDGERFIAPPARAASPAAPVAVPAPLRGLATGVVGLDTETLVRHSETQAASGYLPRTGTATGCASGAAATGFTPNQYLTAYGYDTLQGAGLTGGGQRVALLEIDGFKGSDIATFDSCFGIHAPPIRTMTVGLKKALAPGGETTLDLELLTAAAPGLASIDVYESKGTAAHMLEAFGTPLVAPGAKPQVISASLGICEPFLFLSLGASGVEAIERDLQMAAASGTTVVAASGDLGSSACELGSGQVVTQLAVSYPASSPFVTGVGGTNFELDAGNHITGEVVWNDADKQPSAGGGGHSQLFGRPSYQNGVVSTNDRVVPDVSLMADLAPGYNVFCTASGQMGCDGWDSVGGTSAATPLLAGGFALIDQDLHNHHRKPLGLANPLIYKLATSPQGSTIFHDITAVGSQLGNDLGPFLPGGGKELGCCTAAPGFDAASGWGSLSLAALDQAVLPLLPAAPDVFLTLPGRQRPIAARALQGRLTCSAGCRAYISASVVLSGKSGFSVRSSLRRFAGGGAHMLSIHFTSAQLGRIQTAARAHGHVIAEVFGTAVDGAGRPLATSSAAVWRFSR